MLKKFLVSILICSFLVLPLKAVFAFEEKQEIPVPQETQDPAEIVIPVYYFQDQYGGVLGIAPITEGVFLWVYVFPSDSLETAEIDSSIPKISEVSQDSPAGVGHVFYGGHEYDGDTGLSYMNARYYNGKIGRFISQDSLVMNTPEKVFQDPQALNSYAYARNNPLIYVDPTGNFFETAWDVGNFVYDAGRLVKNTVEVNVGLAKYGYGVITKNQALQNSSLTQMSGDLGDLKSAGIDTAFDAGATMIPFVPAGFTKISNKVSDVVKISEKYNWGIPGKLLDHTQRHGPDFGVNNPADYAKKAQEFKDYAIKNKIDTVTTKNGVVKFYEETTNTFASFNSNGTTKTFFKPNPEIHRMGSNLDYWKAEKGGVR